MLKLELMQFAREVLDVTNRGLQNLQLRLSITHARIWNQFPRDVSMLLDYLGIM